MKALDLAALAANSNSCNESQDSGSNLAPLSLAPSLPIIPSIKFVVTKGSESHEFLSYKALEEWILDECDSEIYNDYKWADSDETRGCDGMKEWVHFCKTSDQLTEYAEDKGWKVERVKE